MRLSNLTCITMTEGKSTMTEGNSRRCIRHTGSPCEKRTVMQEARELNDRMVPKASAVGATSVGVTAGTSYTAPPQQSI
jgi:hypothetical protein